jgi:hypothetical protein
MPTYGTMVSRRAYEPVGFTAENGLKVSGGTCAQARAYVRAQERRRSEAAREKWKREREKEREKVVSVF